MLQPANPVPQVENRDQVEARLLNELRWDIISGSSNTISVQDAQNVDFIRSTILDFLSYLKKRLALPGRTYLNVIHQMGIDLAMYGSAMMNYLGRAKAMLDLADCTIDEFNLYIKGYNKLIPECLVNFRKKLMDIRTTQLRKRHWLIRFDNDFTLDYKIAAYRPIEPKPSYGPATQQIENFISQVRQPDKTRANLQYLVDVLNAALQESDLADWGPKLMPFGSIITGLATFSSDLDLVLKFEHLGVDVIDFDTCLLALETVRPIINYQLGFDIKEWFIHPSRRCPIIAMDFNDCLPANKEPSLKMNRSDASIRNLFSYYNSKLLQFLVKYDRRFYEMAMILKYWAKKVGLIDKDMISTYGLYMMVTYFLQNTSPAILPTIERLQELAKVQPGKRPILEHVYDFSFCDDIRLIDKDKKENLLSTPELLVQFITDFRLFDWRNRVVSPRTGQSLSKAELYDKNMPANLADTSAGFKKTFVAIEDPLLFDNNCGGIYHPIRYNKWKAAFEDAWQRIRTNQRDIVDILTRPRAIPENVFNN